MPIYNYECDLCNAKYSELRTVDTAQIFTVCDACKKGTYQEVL